MKIEPEQGIRNKTKRKIEPELLKDHEWDRTASLIALHWFSGDVHNNKQK